MRRPNVGRLIAGLLAATIVLLICIDTTMACRWLLRRGCAPVMHVSACSAPAPSCCEPAPVTCCESEVVSETVISSDVSDCCTVVDGAVMEVAPEAPHEEHEVDEPTPAPEVADDPMEVTPAEDDPPMPEPELADPVVPAPVDDLPPDDPADEVPALDEFPADDPADMPLDEGFSDPATDVLDEAPADDALDFSEPADDAIDFNEPADDALDFGDAPADPPADDLPAFDEPATDDLPSFDAPVDEAPVEDALPGFDDAPGLDNPVEDALPGDAPADDAGDSLDDLFGAKSQPSEPVALPERLWTDNTGRYQTRGRLVKISLTHVRLLKDNGRFSTVPKMRLSQPDLDYVQQMTAQLGVEEFDQVAQR